MTFITAYIFVLLCILVTIISIAYKKRDKTNGVKFHPKFNSVYRDARGATRKYST